MSVNQLDQGRTRLSAATGAIWRSVQVAIAVAIVVVPFGYAITGVHRDILIAVSCGFAMGVGLSLRMGQRGGRSTGILIGSAIGILAALTSAVTTGSSGVLFVVSPVLVPLALGLIDGLGPSRLSGYRETSIAALTVTALLGIGLLPGFGVVVLILLLCVPQSALIAGYFNRTSAILGRRCGCSSRSSPPWSLLARSGWGILAGYRPSS